MTGLIKLFDSTKFLIISSVKEEWILFWVKRFQYWITLLHVGYVCSGGIREYRVTNERYIKNNNNNNNTKQCGDTCIYKKYKGIIVSYNIYRNCKSEF